MTSLFKRIAAWFRAPAVTTKAPTGRKGPFLFVDLYYKDRGITPDFTKLNSDPRFVGVWLKAWQGLGYDDGGFLKANWRKLKDLGLIRGAYLYLNVREDGARQAKAYWNALEAAGGLQDGDMRPVLDVERAGNDGVSATQVITCVAAAAATLKALSGKDPIFYGRGILEELGITVKMGCRGAINPCYTSRLHQMPPGWDLLLWQYCGDGEGYLKGYPTEAPGLGGVDISCYPWGNDQVAYEKMVAGLTR